MKRTKLFTALFAGFALAIAGMFLFFGNGIAPTASAGRAPSQTAQSAMVSTFYESETFEITAGGNFKFDRGTHNEPGTAMAYYSTSFTGPVVTCGGGGPTGCVVGNQPPTPSVPAPSELEIQQQAQSDRCTFYTGGQLGSRVYTKYKTVNGLNGKGNYTFTWTYTVFGGTVPALTAWTTEGGGGGGSSTVDVGFSGFVSSESYLLQPDRKTKYSFTMIDNGVSRAREVYAQLESSSSSTGPWSPVGTPVNLNDLDLDLNTTPDALTVTATTQDYTYFGNGGVFGNSSVYTALHAPNGLQSTSVTGILSSDQFANNDNHLSTGDVHQANFSGTWTGLGTLGQTTYYRTTVSGILKGNNATGAQSFSVVSQNVQAGNQCNQGQN